MSTKGPNRVPEGDGSDRKGESHAAAVAGLDLDLLDLRDLLSSPPLPPPTPPHAALTILCRKVAAEVVSSMSRPGEEEEGRGDLEAALAVGRLALVVSSSSSSPSSSTSTSTSSSSPPPPSSLREEFRPLFNAARAASVARKALGAALIEVCRRARTQDDGRRGPFLSIALEAEQLLDAGAPLEFSTGHGDTPLTVAASGGSPELVGMLLRRGADPGGNERACTPPIHAAIEGASVDAFGKVWGSHAECVRLLLEAGADPNARDVPPGQGFEEEEQQQHWSALHRAALRNLPLICVLLLETGKVDPDVLGPSGQTPLDLAVYRRHSDVVRVLREAGAGGAAGRRSRSRSKGDGGGRCVVS